jgi:DUF2075 family protein
MIDELDSAKKIEMLVFDVLHSQKIIKNSDNIILKRGIKVDIDKKLKDIGKITVDLLKQKIGLTKEEETLNV